MGGRGQSWLSPLVRGLFLGLLLWSVTNTLRQAGALFFPGMGGVPATYGEAEILLGIGAFGDLLFIWLLVRGGKRGWVHPAAFLWLTLSTMAREEDLCRFMGGLRELTPFILPVLAGMWLIILAFQRAGIRGRVLLVCLLSSLIPMAFLGMGMLQQSRLLLQYALTPLAMESSIFAARMLDGHLVEKIDGGLKGLLDLTPGAKSIRVATPEEYQARAAVAGIPLKRCEITRFDRGADRVTLDFTDIELSKVLALLSRKYSLTFGMSAGGLANKRVTLRAKDVALDEFLLTLDQVPGISLARQGNQIVVSEETATPSSAIGQGGDQGHRRDVLRRSRHERFLVGQNARSLTHPALSLQPDAQGYSQVVTASGARILLIGLPMRDQGRILAVTELEIDYDAWVQPMVEQSPVEAVHRVTPIFPADAETIKAVFGRSLKFQFEKWVPAEWLSLAEPPEHVTAFSFWKPGVTVVPDGLRSVAPSRESFGLDAEVLLRLPTGQERFLHFWYLPQSQVSLALSLPASEVIGKLAEVRWKTTSFGLLALLLAGLMSLLYSGRLSEPVEEITQAARRIRDGELTTLIPRPEDSGEISELAETLAVMAQRLTGRIEAADRQVREEKARFETLVESTWEGIFLIGGDGGIVYANPAGRQLVSDGPTPPPEIPSGFLATLMRTGTEFTPTLPAELSPDLAEFRTVFQIARPELGHNRFISLYLRRCRHPQPGAPGGESGFIAVCRDITVEKEIDRMKSDFVSQVSHELRTPLTSIQAYTEMLLDGEADSPEAQHEYLRIIFDESERLTRLINDLLDLARIESGRRTLRQTWFDLAKTNAAVVEVLQGQAQQKGITITLSNPPGRVMFFGDADLLKQVGLNLLNNAVKYTTSGGRVEVALELRPDGVIIWRFADTGVGLTPKDRDRLFTKFFRAEGELVKAAGGTGLGLVLVKQIVEMHQGRISVESTYGQGSVFSLCFPLPVKAPPPEGGPPTSAGTAA